MSKGVYGVTEQFEEAIAKYTGAPYVVTIDNACNALFLCLYYEKNIAKTIKTDTIAIPSRTYPGVPPEIIRNGFKIDFLPVAGKYLEGPYNLIGSKVWDSALRFTHNMYMPGQFMCCSFTGGLKTFKMGSKAGCILTDDPIAAAWFKRARFSGRREMPYMEDNLDMLGWNYYLNPELSTRGLILMTGFYKDGKPLHFPDVKLPYPDLSQFPVYTEANRKPSLDSLIYDYLFTHKIKGDLSKMNSLERGDAIRAFINESGLGSRLKDY